MYLFEVLYLQIFNIVQCVGFISFSFLELKI